MCRAVGKRLTNAERLHDAISQRGALRWRKVMLDALEDVEEGVRSNLELRYVREVERPHGLPRAQRQVRVVRSGRVYYLDDLYTAYEVGVELDGLVAHPPGERWRDFRRDNAGAADGIITLRYGWADVTGRPCEVAAQVAAVLRRRGWAGSVGSCGPSCAASRRPARVV
jgi:very-short-patch-repair endonuclease